MSMHHKHTKLTRKLCNKYGCGMPVGRKEKQKLLTAINKLESMGIIDEAFDFASEMDRVYFEQHPGVTQYTREAIPGEHEKGFSHIRVTQMQPGIRARQAFNLINS